MPNQPGAGRFDPETLAAYVDGRLPPEERATVAAEIASDPDSYEWLVSTLRAVDDDSIADAARGSAIEPWPVPAPTPAPVTRAIDSSVGGRVSGTGGGEPGGRVLPFYRRRGVQGLAGALLAAAASLALVVQLQPQWWQRLRGPQVDPRFAKLVEAVGEERYIEARLTGGFKYGPLRQVMRGSYNLPSQNLLLLAAAGELQVAARSGATAESLHANGVAQLLVGNLDDAVQQLERAVERSRTADAQLYSDFAAALTVRAERQRVSEDWPRALAYAERALKADPTLGEAKFNVAVSLEGMGMLEAAAKQWRLVAESESHQAWASEASRREAAIKDRLNRQSTQLDREAVESKLISWATATLRGGGADASALLPEIAAATQALAMTGEEMPREAFAIIDRAHRSARRDLATTMAQGFVRYDLAWKLLRTNPQSARAEMAVASRLFSQAACSYAVWSPVFDSIAARDERRYAEAIAILSAVPPPPRQWPRARARYYWAKAVAHEFSGDLSAARDAFVNALEALSSSQDPEELSAVQVLLAEVELELGNKPEVWHLLLQSIASATAAGLTPWRAYLYGSSFAIADGLPEAALHFQDSAIPLFEKTDDFLNLSDVLRERASVFAGEGDVALALADLRSSASMTSRINSPVLRARAEAEVAFAIAQHQLGTPDETAVAIENALNYFVAGKILQRVPLLLRARAKFRRSIGDKSGALVDLQAAIDRYRDERTRLAPLPLVDEMRALADAREIVAEYVQAALSAGVPDVHILATLDEARSPSQSDQGVSGDFRTDDVLTTGLSRDTAVLYFAVVGTRWRSWVLSAEGVFRIEPPVPGNRLNELLSQLDGLVEHDATLDQAASVLRALDDALIEPARTHLQNKLRLIIVPDGNAWRIPFSALLDREHKTLVAKHAITIAPSLRRFFEASANLSSFVADSVTAVGDSHDPISTRLPTIPGADFEAKAVASLYPVSSLLLGAAATEEAILQQRTTVWHFSGHSIVDDRLPAASRLLLAPMSGALTVAQIARQQFVFTRVVVLASCEAASGPLIQHRGPVSFANALLESGVQVVVAPLWNIDDRATALMLEFHRALVRLSDPALALREAQLLFGATVFSQGISTWAGFVSVGGVNYAASKTTH